MKKSLACFLLLTLAFSVVSAAKKTGWEEDGLKGRVKELITIDYVIKNKFGENVQEITGKSIYRYDASEYYFISVSIFE